MKFTRSDWHIIRSAVVDRVLEIALALLAVLALTCAGEWLP